MSFKVVIVINLSEWFAVEKYLNLLTTS